MPSIEDTDTKPCADCGERKPLTDFVRRTGRRARQDARRGTCRDCRKARALAAKEAQAVSSLAAIEALEAVAVSSLAPNGALEPPTSSPLAPNEALEATPASALAANEELEPTAPAQPAPKTRKRRKSAAARAAEASDRGAAQPAAVTAAVAPKARRVLKPLPLPLLMPEGLDLSLLRPTKEGVVRMRGKTDKGRRWVQETDLETATVLVKEFAAVVVNRHTIRRLYSNKAFRNYILSRDKYKCYFCGEPADTIDHLLPRAKGGHTTPVNCVAACALCNQAKADRDIDDFLDSRDPPV